MTTPQEPSELKPCPMCGTKVEYKGFPNLRLQCSQCRLGYLVADYGGDLGTVEACWNQRTQADTAAPIDVIPVDVMEEREITEALNEADNLFDGYDEAAFEEGAIGILYTLTEYIKWLRKTDLIRSIATGQTVPTGWKLVPIEMTPEMISAACVEDWDNWDQKMPHAHYEALYKAMISSVIGSPPSQQGRN